MFKKLILLTILPLMAFATETLTVYTYDSFASKWGPGLKIKEEFEKKYHCVLKYVSLGGGAAILNRLRLEGKHSTADVILGLDVNSIEQAKKLGLVAKHGVKTDKLTIPNGWEDEYFLPYDYGYFAFVYNQNKLKNPPHSMKEFLKTKSKVIYEDPRTSSVGLGLLLWMDKLYPKSTSHAWEQLTKNTVTVTKGWSEAYSMFLKGESDFVLSYTTSPAYHLMVEKKDMYKALSFDEGNYMHIEVAAKTARAKDNKLADKFMHFVISEDFQKYIPTKNYMYPVIDIPLPKEFSALSIPKTALCFSPEVVYKNRQKWIKNWQNAATK